MKPERATFVYFFWSEGSWINEMIYSIYSLCRFVPLPSERITVVVYTTCPGRVRGLPVTVRQVTQEVLAEWIGPHANPFRARFAILREQLSRGGPVVLLDGDTYFRGSPERLLRRVRPGHSVMHIREGEVSRLDDDGHRALHALLSESRGNGDPLGRIRRPEMWNSGVVGIHPADIRVLDEISALHDAVMARKNIFAADQFAFGMPLREHTTLRECYDLVFYYWHRRLRDPFREVLKELLPSLEALPPERRAREAYRYRPRLRPHQEGGGTALADRPARGTTRSERPTAPRSI